MNKFIINECKNKGGQLCMNTLKTVRLIDKYGKCKNCGNVFIGNGQGNLIVGVNNFIRECKCGYKVSVTLNSDGEENLPEITMNGEKI